MKRLYGFLFFLLFSNFSNAQLTKGNWLVGGNGSFTSNKNASTELRTTKLQFAPNIGYFFADKFAGGLKADLLLQNDSYYANGDGVKTNSLVLGPFLRYYFLEEDKMINILLEANYGYGTYSKTGVYPINGGKLSRYSFLAGPVLYFNSSVAVEFTVGYYSNKDITINSTNSGLQIGLGLQIHLKK